jgi:hypothetical protein
MGKKTFIEICGRQYLLKKSKFAIAKSPIHVSDNMSGKMDGIPSISTSCVCNPICIARMKNGNSICAKCFAVATIKHYGALGKALESNFHLLNDSVLDLDLLPRFKSSVEIVRIESFGDVASVTQAVNYANICKVNPNVTFAWWSKNMSIIKKAFDIVGKPNNVIMVESAPMLDTEIQPSCDIVDKTFTVYTKMSHNINCGKRSCMKCRRCYRKDTEKSVKELLK